MSRYHPIQRASASVMFHRLRPKEKLNYYGGVDYPDVSTEYFGLYGSGRFETEPMVPIGYNADLCGIDGPLGLSPSSTVIRPSVSERFAQPLPAIIFDHGVYDQNVPLSTNSSFSAELRETSASPLSEYSEYPQSPPEVPQEDEQFQPEPRIKQEGEMEHLEYGGQMNHLEYERLVERLEYERRQAEQYPPPERCPACYSTIPTLHNAPANNYGPLPPLSSIIPRPITTYLPCTYPSGWPYDTTPQLALQRPVASVVTNNWNWSPYQYGPVHNGNPTVHFNGVGFMVQPQGLAYLRPYPIPCDCQIEPSETFEGSEDSEDSGDSEYSNDYPTP